LAYELNLPPRQLKAWSQNMGHESVLTTLGSYGNLSPHEQADVMGSIATASANDKSNIEAVARQLIEMARRGTEAADLIQK
jgi:hypothetical protein